MGTIKGIPYGMSNFEDVITQNRYYVDKTMYIPMLEDQANYLIFALKRSCILPDPEIPEKLLELIFL